MADDVDLIANDSDSTSKYTTHHKMHRIKSIIKKAVAAILKVFPIIH